MTETAPRRAPESESAQAPASASAPRIGWYVHHHGAGHLTRFLAVRAALTARVVVFSTLPAPRPLPPDTEWVLLDRDDSPEDRADGSVLSPALCEPDAGGLLHWAPLGHRGHAQRFARIAAELAEHPCDAFVVDVSVEVTLQVRLLGVPVVLFAQPGDRRDAPHELGYRLAAHVIAPWPAGAHPALASAAPPVSYVGGISRFAGRSRGATVPGTVFLLGSAAHIDAAHIQAASIQAASIYVAHAQAAHVQAAQQATPDVRWLAPDWTADPWPALCSAEVVVSWAGQNSVADLAAANARAVVIAQPRPFAEQRATADALDRAGLAVLSSGWAQPSQWPALLDRARTLRPEWSNWQVDGAADRAARIILDVAG